MKKHLQEGYPREQEKTVKRYCQFLKLNENTLKEYKHWHKSENVWKEIPQGIRKAGILDMEIFIIDDLAFMILETPIHFDWDEAFGRLSSFERQAEWEAFTSTFQMPRTVGSRSEEKWELVERVFSLHEALDLQK